MAPSVCSTLRRSMACDTGGLPTSIRDFGDAGSAASWAHLDQAALALSGGTLLLHRGRLLSNRMPVLAGERDEAFARGAADRA